LLGGVWFIPGVGSSPFGAEKANQLPQKIAAIPGVASTRAGLDRSTFVQCREGGYQHCGSDKPVRLALEQHLPADGPVDERSACDFYWRTLLIDNGSPLNFSIPKNLQAQGDPGALHRAGTRAGGQCVPREAGGGGRANCFLYSQQRLSRADFRRAARRA